MFYIVVGHREHRQNTHTSIYKVWLLEIVRTFRNTHLPGTYLLQMEGGEI